MKLKSNYYTFDFSYLTLLVIIFFCASMSGCLHVRPDINCHILKKIIHK